MADDKNKPNKPFFPEDPGFESIKNIGRRYGQRTSEDAAERQRLQKASETVNGLSELIDDQPEMAKVPVIARGLKDARESINRLGPRVALRRDTRRERAIRDTVNAVDREFSSRSVNGQVMGSMSNSDVQNRGFSMMGQSQKELESYRGELMGTIGQLEKSTIDTATNSLYDREGRQDPRAMESIRANFRQKGMIANKIAGVNIALKKRRQAGEDEESQDQNLIQTGKIARTQQFQEGISQELRSGQGLGALNKNELQGKESSEAKALIDALERLKNAAGESAETIEKMKEEAKDVAGELKRTQEAIRQGGGGSGGSDTLKKLAYAAPGMLNTAAAAMQESLINQPLSTLGTRAGFAALANQQYAQRNAAINGDMTALLTQGQEVGRTAAEVGENFKSNSNIVRGTNLAAGAITAGLGAGQAINGAKNAGFTLGGLGGSDIVGGLKTGVEGMAQAGTAATDLINESSAQGANLAGQSAMFNLNAEVNKVRGDFRQSFYDYSQGTRTAANLAGGRQGVRIRQAFANDQGGEGGMLGRLQQARIAPNEFGRLAGEAALEQGSVFNENSIFAARKLERSGNGTMDMNVQRMSQLASAGANNPQAALGTVIEAAFSKSLDSSKALSMVVANTAEMARSSVGQSMIGMDTTASSASRLTALVNPNMENKEAAIDRAKTAADIIQDQNQSIGTNFGDMLALTKIARTGGVNMVNAMNLKKIDDPTADALQKNVRDYENMSPNEKTSAGGQKLKSQLQEGFRTIGAPQFLDENGEVKTKEAFGALRERGLSKLSSGGFLNLVDPRKEGYDQFINGKVNPEQLQKQFPQLAEQVQTASANSGLSYREVIAQVRRANGMEEGVTDEGKSKAESAMSGKTGAIGRTMDDAATAGAADMANKARQAAKELGGAADALSKINAQMQALVGKLNDKTAGDMQGAASKSAELFTDASKTFHTSVDRFNEGVNLFSKIPLNTSEAVKAALQPLLDKVNTGMPGSNSNKSKAGAGKL